jgi:hypothetical protein
MRTTLAEHVMIPQLDGGALPLSACTCEPYFIAGGYEYSFTCAIDRHVIKALQERWEFDDAGNVYAAQED